MRVAYFVENANDYAFYMHVYTLNIYTNNRIISKFGEEYTTVLSKSYTTTTSKVNLGFTRFNLDCMRLLTMCEWSLFLFGADMQTFAHFICTFAHKLYTPIMEFEVTLKHKNKRFI